MGAYELPYHVVPAPPDQYTSGTVLGHYMDGLGFRYRWATEGLSSQEMDYRICEAGRSIKETLAHILNIVTMVECAFTGETYEMPEREVTLGLAELRKATLHRIEWTALARPLTSSWSQPSPDPNTELSLVSGAQITGASAQTSTDRQLVHPAPGLLYVVSAPPLCCVGSSSVRG